MPLFVCDECGNVDNTACTRFWTRRRKGLPALCSVCDPDVPEHRHFPLEPWDGHLAVENRSPLPHARR